MDSCQVMGILALTAVTLINFALIGKPMLWCAAVTDVTFTTSTVLFCRFSVCGASFVRHAWKKARSPHSDSGLNATKYRFYVGELVSETDSEHNATTSDCHVHRSRHNLSRCRSQSMKGRSAASTCLRWRMATPRKFGNMGRYIFPD